MGGGSAKIEDIRKYHSKEMLRAMEKSTGDDLIERGIKLPWRSRLRRWWFGWKVSR